jgi:Bifunctional DNA primase/polymerase, N-terminal
VDVKLMKSMKFDDYDFLNPLPIQRPPPERSRCSESQPSAQHGVLDTLYNLLGERTVLLPLVPGEKAPKNAAWQKTTFEDTQEPDYQKELRAAVNIGALLTGGLASIDIDDDQFIGEFLGLNPRLRETLRSRGARGCNLWVRLVGDYPARIIFLKKADGTKWGEWRGNLQTVIHGTHPITGRPYQRVVDKSVVEIEFDSIIWPVDLILPWKKKEQPQAEPKPYDPDKRIWAYVDAIPGAIEGQEGHVQTFKVACKLVNGWELSTTEALPYLQAYNLRCEPPWTDKELLHKLESAQEASHDEPRGHLRNGGHQQPVEPPPSDITEIAQKLEIFYDSNRMSFWVKNDRSTWMMVSVSDVRRRLKEKGFRSRALEGELVSQVDSLLTAIQHSNDVDYADSLAGYKTGVYLIRGKRILVKDSPTLIVPSKGDWPFLSGILDRMLGEQKIYLFGWLKVALEALYTSRFRVGQALVLAGPVDCGKSLTQELLTLLLGGRVAKPHRYMSGLTPFNSELLGCEHLMIEDEEASTDIRARRNFGSHIKSICANQDQSAHAKYRNAITLGPFWRLTISVNDEPESLMILPPIDKSLEDKFIILKAESHPMPMETVTDRDREAFMSVLKAELSHFIQFLFDFKIPAALSSDRYGITHFHHPDILEAISAMAPETRLLELIDARLFDSPAPGSWQGKADKLERELTCEASCVRRQAERLLTFHLACGTYLGRLQKLHPKRFASLHTKNGNVWTIHPS